MNAEVWNSKVDFCRVSSLEVNDKFLFQGTWFRVTSKDKDNIRYVSVANKFSKKGTNKFGAKSQQFVQVMKFQGVTII